MIKKGHKPYWEMNSSLRFHSSVRKNFKFHFKQLECTHITFTFSPSELFWEKKTFWLFNGASSHNLPLLSFSSENMGDLAFVRWGWSNRSPSCWPLFTSGLDNKKEDEGSAVGGWGCNCWCLDCDCCWWVDATVLRVWAKEERKTCYYLPKISLDVHD